MCNLLVDVNRITMLDPQTSDMRHIYGTQNDISPPSGIIYIDLTHIAATNTASDESQISSHIEYLIYLILTQYYCAHLVLKIDEKSSLTGGILIRFNDDS